MSSSQSKKYLPNSKPCFVCGEDNTAGLQTRFYVEDGYVKAPLRAQPHHCGYPNVVHGGIVAALLDETMGWAAARQVGRMCYTGELKIRYLRPTPADRSLLARASVDKPSKRIISAQGELVDDEGTVYARGEGRFVPLSVEQTLNVDDGLLYRGGEEHVFDSLRHDQKQD